MSPAEAVATAARHLGNRVRELREGKGLSRAELATKTQISESTIKNVETGRHLPSPTTLAMLNQALECDLSATLAPSPPGPSAEALLVVDAVTLLLQRCPIPLPTTTLALIFERSALPALAEAAALAKVDRQQLAIALLQRGDHE